MVQPDIVKMGGITGLMQCAAICFAHSVELVPHQTQPGFAHAANLHVVATLMHNTKPAEYSDASGRMDAGFKNSIRPENGRFKVPSRPGLGLEVDEDAIARRRV
jgi:L-alanine-DL-glutamate epimerase-like enolase superfamily enzyme